MQQNLSSVSNSAPRVLVPSRKRDIWLIAHRLTQYGRRLFLRGRYPQLQFGHHFDISNGLELRLTPKASIIFGNNCVVDRGMTLLCEGTLIIGNGTVFGHHCTVGACERIEIGENCLIAEMVSIRDHDHRFDEINIPILQQGSISSPISIGNNVWLAGKVTVLRGVTIGDNAVIGANSVVTHDIPANAVAVGAPARIIRFRTESSHREDAR